VVLGASGGGAAGAGHGRHVFPPRTASGLAERAAGETARRREKEIEGSRGSLEPPGSLLTHLHTVYMPYSECLPTHLNPLVAERTCFSQVRSGLRGLAAAAARARRGAKRAAGRGAAVADGDEAAASCGLAVDV
jgi:hypothetical protein